MVIPGQVGLFDAQTRVAVESFTRLCGAMELEYGEGPWTLGSVAEFQDVARRIGIPRATFFRHLRQLRGHGLVKLETRTTLYPMEINR